MDKKTFRSAFEAIKPELSIKLRAFAIPKDSEAIQLTVIEYLNRLFDGNGEFRQNLTQSEDYICQATLGLLQSQQEMLIKLASGKESKESKQTEQAQEQSSVVCKERYPWIIGGTLVGGAAGILAGSIGTLAGALAGTAITLYCVADNSRHKTTCEKKETKELPHIQPFDIEEFLSIIERLCDSIDNVVNTFRTQIQRVKMSYENVDPPTFIGSYPALASNLEQLFETTDINPSNADSIITLVNLVKRSLKNYGITYENGKLIEKR